MLFILDYNLNRSVIKLTVIGTDVIGITSQTYGIAAMFNYVDDIAHVESATLPPAGNSNTFRAGYFDGSLTEMFTQPEEAEI